MLNMSNKHIFLRFFIINDTVVYQIAMINCQEPCNMIVTTCCPNCTNHLILFWLSN
jgi:hypothetical protein